MTREVDEKLHSHAPVVMIEAAGGCGKTTKAAKYAAEAAERLSAGKVLLLSHTHAACGEFQRKCAALGKKIDVETCDSFCLKAIRAYARPLGLPAPIDSHLGRTEGGISFSELSSKTAELFRRAPTVARAVAAHYPVIVLDEHQDASTHQHETVKLLREIGDARLRIFGDPMQALHPANDANSYVNWDALWATADDTSSLEVPHRWADAPELGEWVMASRAALKAGNPVSLCGAPPCVTAVTHNYLAGRERFRDVPTASRAVHGFLNGAPDSAAILAFIGNMAKSAAQAGSWRAPLNEGAQLDELDALIQAMEGQAGDAKALAGSLLDFLCIIGVGISHDISVGLRRRLGAAINRDRAGQNQVAWLDCLEPIYESPDHRGMAAAMRKVRDGAPGYTIRFGDHVWALCAFDRTDDPRAFRSTLGRIRRRRKWPAQMVSTIHKAKGLDFDHVLLCPVDRHQYPDDVLGARLLYVALSRARQSVRLVLAGDAPSRHLITR
jgi:hypothetical protein